MKMFITLLLTALLTACVNTNKGSEDLKENSYSYLLLQPVSHEKITKTSLNEQKQLQDEVFSLLTTVPKNKRGLSYKHINMRTDYITTYEALNYQLKKVETDSFEEKAILYRLYTLNRQFIADYK